MASPERDALTIEEYRQYVERTTRERDFQRMVEDFAHHMGWSLTYHTYDSRRSDEGFPDLVAIRDERLLFACAVELRALRHPVLKYLNFVPGNGPGTRPWRRHVARLHEHDQRAFVRLARLDHGAVLGTLHQ